MFNQADFIGWAKQLVRAQEIIDQADRLAPTVVKLEERKKALSAEVADLLAKTETHRKNGAALIAELEGKRGALTNEIEAQRETMAREMKNHQADVAKSAADHDAIKTARMTQLDTIVNDRRRTIKGLEDKIAALKAEIDTTLAKYR